MQDTRGAQAFVAVAEHRSFTVASRALGVTPSALSQAVRGLEERVGVPLLVRTTRSVRLTDAGQRLFERLGPALRETSAALDEARGSAAIVRGTLRLSVGRMMVPLVIQPVIGPLLAAHPELAIEVSVDDTFVDIVAAGFDAGVRLNESIEQDYTVVRLTSAFRLVVAGAPSYLARRGRPKRPRDLLGHDCLNYRMSSTGAFYAWEFERRGKEEALAVVGRFACNDGPLMLDAALAGHGLVYLHEPALAPHVARGDLALVLEDYAVSVPGLFLYFPRRTGVEPKLRAFIEVAKRVLPPATGVVGAAKRRPASRRR